MVASTALGATAFLALEAIGGAITLNYGVSNSIFAILTVNLVILLTGTPICYYAAKHGLDIDLLTRGAGFGYLGSTITSLIYASFTFIFFAIEAAILAIALKVIFSIPLAIGYVLCAIAVIPIVTHGITWISKFQTRTQAIWIILQIIAIAPVLYVELPKLQQWLSFQGINQINTDQQPIHQGFDLILFGAASSVLFAMVAQIGEQVDYLRFLPEQKKISKLKWWSALFFTWPGWILPGILKMLFGSFLAWLAFSRGQTPELAYRLTWAERLKRVFHIDIERCEHCRGKVSIIATIKDPIVIKKILDHLDAKQSLDSIPAYQLPHAQAPPSQYFL